MRPALTVALLLVGSLAFAQAERYELGARLKAFEAEWDKQTDKDARKRALADLPKVTNQFFSFQFGNAGKTLDDARFALLSDKPQPEAVLWATSLYPEVKLRLTSEKEVPITVKQFYTVKAERPKGVSVRAGFDGQTWTTAEVEKLPMKLTVPMPEKVNRPADLVLMVEVTVDEKPLARRTVEVSAFDGKPWIEDDRLLKPDRTPPAVEAVSVVERVALLNELAEGTIPETDVSAARRYRELLVLRNRITLNSNYFATEQDGDHWLSIPTGKDGKTVTPCRLFVPEKLDPKKPVPLVLALHGAGGSENLFFEGYGNGHIVKLCKDRGWLLVAPRAGLGFGITPAPPFGEIVDELAKRYPVDPKRVFVVGHSMGAGMAITAAQTYPGKFAGVACLGGGGAVRKAEAFADLPVFVGVGDKDFALRSAKGLQTALGKTTAKVTYKEYPEVEHLMIVREALGDVFDLFDMLK